VFTFLGHILHTRPYAQISIHRADLQSALYRAAVSHDGPGKACTVLLDHKVAKLVCSSVSFDCLPDSHIGPQNADTGVVELFNGETLQGDVVIAADGIRSNVRRFVLGKEVTPEPSGESAYRMLIQVEDLQAVNHLVLEDGNLPATMHVVFAPKRQIVAYPIREGRFLNVVAFVRECTISADSDFRRSSCVPFTADAELHEDVDDKWTRKGSVTSLVKAYNHFSPYWKGLLSYVTSPVNVRSSSVVTNRAGKDVGIWQMRDLPPLDTWVKGRAILIGDAAHPSRCSWLPFGLSKLIT
jgi:salicylate hydroxylase